MKPVGAEVGLTYDTDGTLQAGHFLRTTTGRAYIVTSAREVGTAPWPWSRPWKVRAVVIRRSEVPADAVIHPVRWYPRGRHR
jgi:hypothetical protein